MSSPGIAPESTQALQAEEQVGRMSWELEGDAAALCQDLLFWPDDYQNLGQVWYPMKPPAQDPNFFCPLKARVYQPELWGLRLYLLCSESQASLKCVSSLYWTVFSYLCGVCLLFRFQLWRGEKENETFSVGLFDVFSHTVGCHQKAITLACTSAGPEPGDGCQQALLTQPGLTGITLRCCQREQRWAWGWRKGRESQHHIYFLDRYTES